MYLYLYFMEYLFIWDSVHWKVTDLKNIFYIYFFYHGWTFLGNQFFDRIMLLFMTPKMQPDYVYLRHVPLRKVHLFTIIQMICFALLYAIKVQIFIFL